MENNNETQSVDSQESIETVNQQTNAEQSPIQTEQDFVAQRERQAFDIYVKNQGIEIPKNFKDANAWFDSLKNAQKEYTKTRQELSELKKTYEKNGTTNPNYVEETENNSEEVVVEETKPVSKIPEELRIPDISKQKEETKQPQEQSKTISEDDWSKWTMEVAISNDLSEETKLEIKAKTGFTDKMIGDYLEGQKARSREAYGKAAEVIGGKDRLATIFEWAGKNLTTQQQAEVNATLASPSWEVALLGLEAKYNKAMGQKPKAKEMSSSTNKQIPNTNTKQPVQPYKSRREFYAERGSQKYMSDPNFRTYVEQRVLLSDITNLPN